MANHTCADGTTIYHQQNQAVVWTPTRALQFNNVRENAEFARQAAVHGVSGIQTNVTLMEPSSDGFINVESVGCGLSSPIWTGTLADPALMNGTNANSTLDFKNRFCFFEGIWGDNAAPLNYVPGGVTDHAFVNSPLLSGGWFTGPGAADYSGDHVFGLIVPGSFTMYLWVDDNTGVLHGYFNATYRPIWSLRFKFGPIWVAP